MKRSESRHEFIVRLIFYRVEVESPYTVGASPHSFMVLLLRNYNCEKARCIFRTILRPTEACQEELVNEADVLNSMIMTPVAIARRLRCPGCLSGKNKEVQRRCYFHSPRRDNQQGGQCHVLCLNCVLSTSETVKVTQQPKLLHMYVIDDSVYCVWIRGAGRFTISAIRMVS